MEYKVDDVFFFWGNTVRMAQWIRRLPTEQEILGSSPSTDLFFFLEVNVTRTGEVDEMLWTHNENNA